MANEPKTETAQDVRKDIMALVDKLPDAVLESVTTYATGMLNAYTLCKLHGGKSA